MNGAQVTKCMFLLANTSNLSDDTLRSSITDSLNLSVEKSCTFMKTYCQQVQTQTHANTQITCIALESCD